MLTLKRLRLEADAAISAAIMFGAVFAAATPAQTAPSTQDTRFQ